MHDCPDCYSPDDDEDDYAYTPLCTMCGVPSCEG